MSLRCWMGISVILGSIGRLLSYDPEMSRPPGLNRIGKDSWGKTESGWRLAFALPKDAYGTNEPIFGAASLRNEMDASQLLITNSDGEGDYQISILDEHGRTVPKQGLARGFFNLHNVHVGTHGEHVGRVLANRSHSLTPGVYRITISQNVPDANGKLTISIFSATNTVRVLNVPATGTNGEPVKVSSPAAR